MKKLQTYGGYLQESYGIRNDRPLTDFLTRRNAQLYLGDRINLNMMASRYGAPLEIAYYPQITRQINNIHIWASQARRTTGYRGTFLYAYATKANFTAEVVQTALRAGAHYETSAAADVAIAAHLWREGELPDERLLLCNGSKDADYLAQICHLRQQGYKQIIPVLDDLAELTSLEVCTAPLQLGVRERAAGNRNAAQPGNDRFGLTVPEIDQIVAQLTHSHHRLILYHAMVGSQIENEAQFLALLDESLVAYCRLRQRVPTLRYLNFGGGLPTSGYRLDFNFDYVGFLRRLMARVQQICAVFGVPEPDLVGEFGRYTVANHSVTLFEVGAVKTTATGQPDWYLLNGSLMVALPDILMVPDQQFLILPLDHWERPIRPVRLAGRATCDSDDVYPHLDQPPLYLPDVGTGLVVAVFGTGAYQKLLSGLGGVHHCLSPEPPQLKIHEINGRLQFRRTPQQSHDVMMRLLGYEPQPEHTAVYTAHHLAYQQRQVG